MHNVIVTGGSRGLGLGIAKRLVESGFRAIAVARKECVELAEAVTKAEENHHGALRFVPFDLAEIERIPDLVKQLRKEFGPIYGLVNNAGISIDGALAMTSTQQIEQALALEHDFARRAHQICGASHDGRWRRAHRQHLFDYRFHRLQRSFGIRGHKASLLGFTRSLAREVGRMGVNVNAVAPGFVETGMTEGLKEKQREQIARRSALKRMVEVEDVANAVEFLMSDGSKNITGTVITVDAGNTA